MTREQIKAMLPDGTDDSAVTKILDALHNEINPFKTAAEQARNDLAAKVAEMEEISKKAATADEKAKALDELQAKYTADLKAANEKAEALAFDGSLDGILREHGARNLKAARALLDLDTLRASTNRDADMKAAIEALKGAEDTAFLFGAQPTGGKFNVGGDPGAPGGVGDGVEAAFRAKNPNLKI